jgi:hypothetical protein
MMGCLKRRHCPESRRYKARHHADRSTCMLACGIAFAGRSLGMDEHHHHASLDRLDRTLERTVRLARSSFCAMDSSNCAWILLRCIKQGLHGPRFSAESFSRGCHWFPCLLEGSECYKWHASRMFTLLPVDAAISIHTLKVLGAGARFH